MNKVLYLLYTVVSILMFFPNPLKAQDDPRSAMIKDTLDGTSAENGVCVDHCKSKDFSPEDLVLIPSLPGTSCLAVDCSKCHCACFLEEQFEDNKGVFPVLLCTCTCVNWLRESGKIPLYQIPSWQTTWTRCPKPALSSNYFLPSPFLSCMGDYLEYVKQNKQCDCYWPEKSTQATSIRKRAYQLFYDLVHETALEDLLVDAELNERFGFYELKGAKYHVRDSFCAVCNKACVHRSFFFTDYVWVCDYLEFYSKKYFSSKDYLPIMSRLNDILDELVPLFRELYKSCLQKHPSEKIKKEYAYLDAWEGVLDLFTDEENIITLSDTVFPIQHNAPVPSDHSHAIKCSSRSKRSSFRKSKVYSKSSNRLKSRRASTSKIAKPPKQVILGQPKATYKSKSVEKRPENWLESDLLLARGRILNEYFLYEEAVSVLSKAITLNQKNINAYVERAIAYFELGQLDKALEDYKKIQQLTTIPPFIIGTSSSCCTKAYGVEYAFDPEFSEGLIVGALSGGKDWGKELWTSAKGLCHGLWAFTASPRDVSRELCESLYLFGEYLSTHSGDEDLELLLPEIATLIDEWDSSDMYNKGHMLGYVVGKYGIDVFTLRAGSSAKIASRFGSLKRANTMCTLAQCARSDACRATIVAEIAKRAAGRIGFVAYKKRSIVIRNPNVIPHLMDRKHAWEKVISLSGDMEKDAQKVIEVLEQHEAWHPKFILKKDEKAAIKKVIVNSSELLRVDHKLFVNGHEVELQFIYNPKSTDLFIIDGWVVPKK